MQLLHNTNLIDRVKRQTSMAKPEHGCLAMINNQFDRANNLKKNTVHMLRAFHMIQWKALRETDPERHPAVSY